MLRSLAAKSVRVAPTFLKPEKISSRCLAISNPHRIPALARHGHVGQIRFLSVTSSRFAEAAKAAAENSSKLGTKDELVLDFLPEKPAPTGSGVTEISGADPPLESLGLASWYPSGRVQYFLDMLHTSFDMPWCGAIFATTVLIRLIVFPLVVISQRNAAKLANNSPQMRAIQERMTDARNRGDMYDSAVAGNELKEFMAKKGINPMKSILPVIGPFPFFMSMFFGLHGMANLPLGSFTAGGMLWFQDLTVPDPYYGLPFMTAASFGLQLKFAAESASFDSLGRTSQYVMRCFPFILFPLTMNFPAAVTFYWFITNVISIVQSKVCRIGSVRKILGIPEIVKPPPSEKEKKAKKGFAGAKEAFSETFQNFKVQSELIDRRAYDEQVFREVGQSKPKRTFKFDPTKARRAPRKFSS